MIIAIAIRIVVVALHLESFNRSFICLTFAFKMHVLVKTGLHDTNACFILLMN